MRRILFLFSIATLSLLTNCQRKATPLTAAGFNQQIQSQEDGIIMVGAVNRGGLQKTPYQDWFDAGYKTYTVDAATLQSVKDKLKNTEILVFMGTWCSDSQREVPHFYKILDNVGYNERKLKVVAVDNHPDRYKQSPQHEEKGWNIENVPTIILVQNGKELGRIVETPQQTLEKDLAAILSK